MARREEILKCDLSILTDREKQLITLYYDRLMTIKAVCAELPTYKYDTKAMSYIVKEVGIPTEYFSVIHKNALRKLGFVK